MMCKLDFLLFLGFTIFLLTLVRTGAGDNVKKSVDDNRDEDMNDDGKDDSMDIPAEPESVSNITTCTRRKNNQVHEIRSANPKQFPFMAALMSPRNEYVCAGAIISNGLILTTAQCTEYISYVLVNTTNDKKGDNTISLHIIKSEKFPSFTGTSSLKDVAVIYTETHNNTIANKINLSNNTFSRGLNTILAIGFGLNTDVGNVKELQYVGLDARDTKEDSIVGYIDCIDTKVLTCFKDKGGPVIVDNELVGLITKGQDECTDEIMSKYAINKRMIDALPIYTVKAWIEEKIAKSMSQGGELLETYPKEPVFRQGIVHKMTSTGEINKAMPFCIVMLQYSVFNM